MKADFLIVGQGLAGSLLGWELIQRGLRIIIVDPGLENASGIAAGLINPVTGMRLVKTPDVERLLPAAVDYYRRLERFFKRTFYIEKPMLRIFGSKRESDCGAIRKRDSAYQGYLGELLAPDEFGNGICAPLGGIVQKKTGYLLTAPLLDCLRQFFRDRGAYAQTKLHCRDLIAGMGRIRWGETEASGVIFCEGYIASANPFFSWLPFRPVKGEILTLKAAASTLPDAILNYGHWLIPVGDGSFRTGATFERERVDTEITERARQELLGRLASAAPSLAKAEVTEQKANIRPCTFDKRPFAGRHPVLTRLMIFNGFGAKGSLQIPGYAKCFAEALTDGPPLPGQIDIARHYATHFTG
ncbi:MAG: NAD(P)/FAD-dependent oxidoreductase [Gammaproteobacteria bacterium]